MPTTYNGIGTTYFRRRNPSQRTGVCEFCRKYATLTNYDTTLVFSVFYLPLIPLGKKHIVDECSVCSRHRVLKAAEWERIRGEADAQIAAFETSPQPTDDDFMTALSAAVFTQQPARLSAAVARMRQVMPPSADRELLAGETFRRMGDAAAAEDAIKRAVALRDDARTNAALATVYLGTDRPDDAKRHLKHILSGQDNGNMGLANALGQGYQSQGRHKEALEVFDQMTRAMPELATDKTMLKSRQISERAGHSNKRVKPRLFVGADGSLLEAPKSAARSWGIAAAVLLVALVGYLIFSAVQAGRRGVQLVGNLGRSYSVQIDGVSYEVPARGEVKIRLAEGTHTLTFGDDRYLPTTESFEIPAVNIFVRPFSEDAFVLNPDGTALLVDETVLYGNTNVSNCIKPDIRVGQTFYTFHNIDYDFIDPPTKLKLKNTKQASRHHLYCHRENLDAADLINAALEEKGEPAASAVTLRLLRDLDNQDVTHTIPKFVPHGPLVATLRERAAARPKDASTLELLEALQITK